MGIYPDHGIEYRAVRADGTHIVVASTKDTDERLLASAFLDARGGMEAWMSPQVTCLTDYSRPITEHVVDVELTDAEKTRLNSILTVHEIESHGWCDVNTIHTTYDM